MKTVLMAFATTLVLNTSALGSAKNSFDIQKNHYEFCEPNPESPILHTVDLQLIQHLSNEAVEKKINQAIRDFIFQKLNPDQLKDLAPCKKKSVSASERSVEISAATENLIQVLISSVSFAGGSAHSNEIQYFDIRDGKVYRAESFFTPSGIRTLNKAVKAALKKLDGDCSRSFVTILNRNQSYWTFNDRGMQVNFQVKALSDCEEIDPSVSLDKATVKTAIIPDGPMSAWK